MQLHDQEWNTSRNQLGDKSSCPKCCLCPQLASASCGLHEWHELKLQIKPPWRISESDRKKRGHFHWVCGDEPVYDGGVLAQSSFHSRTESGVSGGLSCSGVVVRYAGIWRIWSLLEQLVIFQHALVNSTGKNKYTPKKYPWSLWALPSGSECPQRMPQSVWLFPQSPPSGETTVSAQCVTKTTRYGKDETQRWPLTNKLTCSSLSRSSS